MCSGQLVLGLHTQAVLPGEAFRRPPQLVPFQICVHVHVWLGIWVGRLVLAIYRVSGQNSLSFTDDYARLAALQATRESLASVSTLLPACWDYGCLHPHPAVTGSEDRNTCCQVYRAMLSHWAIPHPSPPLVILRNITSAFVCCLLWNKPNKYKITMVVQAKREV